MEILSTMLCDNAVADDDKDNNKSNNGNKH